MILFASALEERCIYENHETTRWCHIRHQHAGERTRHRWSGQGHKCTGTYPEVDLENTLESIQVRNTIPFFLSLTYQDNDS